MGKKLHANFKDLGVHKYIKHNFFFCHKDEVGEDFCSVHIRLDKKADSEKLLIQLIRKDIETRDLINDEEVALCDITPVRFNSGQICFVVKEIDS